MKNEIIKNKIKELDKEVKNLNSGSYIKMMPQTTAVNISLYFKSPLSLESDFKTFNTSNPTLALKV